MLSSVQKGGGGKNEIGTREGTAKRKKNPGKGGVLGSFKRSKTGNEARGQGQRLDKGGDKH